MNFIYILYKKGIPFYVGKTNNWERRLVEHKRTYSGFEMEVVEEVNDFKFWEEFYIDLLLSWGFKLENIFRKSVGVDFHTNKTKQKISESNKGKSRNLGRKYKKKHKEKMSVAKKGIPLSEEHKEKIRKSKLGITNKKTSESMKLFYKKYGCTWGDKISLSKKGKPTGINYKKVAEKNSIPIIQYDLEGNFIREFPSQAEACRIMNIDSGQLSNHLKNSNSKHVKNYKYVIK